MRFSKVAAARVGLAARSTRHGPWREPPAISGAGERRTGRVRCSSGPSQCRFLRRRRPLLGTGLSSLRERIMTRAIGDGDGASTTKRRQQYSPFHRRVSRPPVSHIVGYRVECRAAASCRGFRSRQRSPVQSSGGCLPHHQAGRLSPETAPGAQLAPGGLIQYHWQCPAVAGSRRRREAASRRGCERSRCRRRRPSE